MANLQTDEEVERQTINYHNYSKANLERIMPAGKFNADQRPPLQWRFDGGMPNIRKTNKNAANVNNKEMTNLIQQKSISL